MKDLNDEQMSAVKFVGNILISAGAGTGKTTVLIKKLSYMIEERNIDANNILVVTFTNKAANEIKERINNNHIKWIGTFHNLCAKILRYNADEIKNFEIIDYAEQIKFLKHFSDNPKEVLENILLAKEKMKPLNNLIANEYQEYLRQNNKLDFSDLMLNALKLLQHNEEVLTTYRKKFKVILIDEYQDTNDVQYELIKILSSENEVCCVGDEDQSIYEWRGANINNFKKFIDDFNAEVMILNRNYRSTQNILNLAGKLIKNNQHRINNKNLTANIPNDGIIKYKSFKNPYAEAKYIAKVMTSYSNVVILARLTMQIPIVAKALQELKVRYQIHGSMNLYDREEIKNLMAFLTLWERDDNNSFLRVINVPKKGIGKVTIEKLQLRNDNLMLAANDFEKQSVCDFYNMIHQWRVKDDMTLDRKIEIILSDTQYQLDNMDYINEFKNLVTHLYNIDEIHNQNVINIMTIHASKGLEFDNVFLIGMSENILPLNNNNIEEERRIAYVAVTRAKKSLYITSYESHLSSNRLVQTKESRFINEMGLSSDSKTVFHKKFKYGKIINQSGDTVTIDFYQYGKKTILKNFLE